MPRLTPILTALILAAGAASAETGTKPPATAATPPPAAALRQAPSVQPRLTITSFQRQESFGSLGQDVVAKISNASASPLPKGDWGLEVKCTSPSSPQHVVRRALDAIPGHAQLEITVFANKQSVPGAPPPTIFGPPIPNAQNPLGGLGWGGTLSPPQRQAAPLMDPDPKPPLVAGPAWSCTAGLGPASGAGGFPVQSTAAWGVEFDFGISDISFEKAMTAPPTVNVKVSVLSKKIGNALWAPRIDSLKRSLHLECSKQGSPPKTADLPAADTVLFGSAAAGFLPAPATGWSCKATLAGPGPDKDPSNDSWSLTAP